MKVKKVKLAAPIRDWTAERELSNCRAVLADLVRRPGVSQGTVLYDSSILSVRVRIAVCKMLSNGCIHTGGESGSVAQLMNQHFNLGALHNTWGSRIEVTDAIRANPALVAKLKELCQADLTTSLLVENERGSSLHQASNRAYIENAHTENLVVLDKGVGANKYNRWISFRNAQFLELAGGAVSALRPDTQKADTARVVAALQAGLQIEFSFTKEAPTVKATVRNL